MGVLSSRILLRPGDLDHSRRLYRDLLGRDAWQREADWPVLRVPHLARLVKRQLAGGRVGDNAGSGGCGCLSCSRMRRLPAA
jgi:hypothetical protein